MTPTITSNHDRFCAFRSSASCLQAPRRRRPSTAPAGTGIVSLALPGAESPGREAGPTLERAGEVGVIRVAELPCDLPDPPSRVLQHVARRRVARMLYDVSVRQPTLAKPPLQRSHARPDRVGDEANVRRAVSARQARPDRLAHALPDVAGRRRLWPRHRMLPDAAVPGLWPFASGRFPARPSRSAGNPVRCASKVQWCPIGTTRTPSSPTGPRPVLPDHATAGPGRAGAAAFVGSGGRVVGSWRDRRGDLPGLPAKSLGPCEDSSPDRECRGGESNPYTLAGCGF